MQKKHPPMHIADIGRCFFLYSVRLSWQTFAGIRFQLSLSSLTSLLSLHLVDDGNGTFNRQYDSQNN